MLPAADRLAPDRFRSLLARLRRTVRALRGSRHSLGAPTIRRLIIMLQNRCALRCRMCDLWLEKPIVFPADRVLPLLSSPALHPDASVHFTGGEPLLYPGFADLYDRVRARRPGRLMSISSSGEPPEAVKAFLERGPDLGSTMLVFSYDGAGTHDRQRGVGGAEERLLSLLEYVLRRISPAQVFLRMTVTPENAHAVRPTFLKARELGVGLQVRQAGHYPQYTNSMRPAGVSPFSAPSSSRLAEDLTAVFNAHHPFRENQELAHLLGFIERLETSCSPAGERRAVCPVPSSSAFIRNDGALLTCRAAEPVGDVLKDGLEAAWNSAAACRLRSDGCGACEPWYSE